jgi:hypothetical protein
MNIKNMPEALKIETETVNKNMEGALRRAKKKLMAENGINPMLEIVVVHERKGVLTMPMVELGEIPDNKKEKLELMYTVGQYIGKKFGNELLITQVTMLSEGWQRDVDGKTGDISKKIEVLFAATQTWDGREGVLSQRIVRETDGEILGTIDSEEHLATDDKQDGDNPLLKMFFVGFATASVRAGGSTTKEVIESSKEVEDMVEALFSE